MTSAEAIEQACEALKRLLLEKNAAYGDSAFYPLTYRGKTISAEDGIDIRIADKVKRLMCGSECGEDTELDLAGYIVLKRAVRIKERVEAHEEYDPAG